MAVLEALAHGLPVICTDLGGPAQIVNHHCGRVDCDDNTDLPTMIAGDLAASCASWRKILGCGNP